MAFILGMLLGIVATALAVYVVIHGLVPDDENDNDAK